LVAAQRDLQQGVTPTDDRLTTAQFLDRWLEDVARPTVRPRTFVSYSQTVALHLKPAVGRTPLSRLRPQHVQALLNAKLASGLSPRSVGIIHAVLRGALNQALRWGVVPRNVATLAQPPRATRAEITPLTPEQARAFLDAVKGDRLEALYSVGLALGLRQGEVLGLEWTDVDLEAGTLRVAHALQRVNGRLALVEPKSRSSRRTIPMPATVARALRAHRSRHLEERLAAGARWCESDLVFTTALGTPLDSRNLTRRFQAALERAGLPHLRFHDLRHTAASLMLAQGIAPRVVMETLGHSQISLTMDTYSHVIPALQRDAADRMEAVLSNR
jgi:integrase